MKKNIKILFVLLLMGIVPSQALPILCVNTRKAQKPKEFNRIYRFDKRKIGKTGKTNTAVEVLLEDFQKHTKVGTKRYFIGTDDNINYTIPMNVGSVDVNGTTAQTWTLPNLDLLDTYSLNLEHVTVESTGLENVYPEVNQAIKVLETGEYQLQTLDADELFVYGYTEFDSVTQEYEVIDYYTAITTVPLKIGESYTGTVVFEYTSDPNYDSTVWLQHYDVVGYGTLNLPNGETSEAIKLIFTEEEKDYKDGIEIAYSTYDEYIWYSKDGHYVRAGVEDAWAEEGETELYYLDYQYIEKVGDVTGLEDFTQYSLNLFPNPVAKGQTLNFQTDVNFRPNLVELFDIQGRKVGSMPLSGNSNNQFEVGIPQSLTSGVYFYLAYDQKENGLARGKIIIE